MDLPRIGTFATFHVQRSPSTSMRCRYGVSFGSSSGSVRALQTSLREDLSVADELLLAVKRVMGLLVVARGMGTVGRLGWPPSVKPSGDPVPDLRVSHPLGVLCDHHRTGEVALPTVVWILIWVVVLGTVAFFAVREVRSGRKQPAEFDRTKHEAVREAECGPPGPADRTASASGG